MSVRNSAIAAIIIAVTFAAIGRWTAPEKIKTETKIVEVEKKTEHSDTEADKNKHKETTTHEITRPDGTKETTTTVVEDSNANRHNTTDKTDDKSKSEDISKEVTKSGSKLTLSALAGVKVSDPTGMIYGGHVTKDILGPINIGVWGMSNNTAGLSIGLTF